MQLMMMMTVILISNNKLHIKILTNIHSLFYFIKKQKGNISLELD